MPAAVGNAREESGRHTAETETRGQRPLGAASIVEESALRLRLALRAFIWWPARRNWLVASRPFGGSLAVKVWLRRRSQIVRLQAAGGPVERRVQNRSVSWRKRLDTWLGCCRTPSGECGSRLRENRCRG